ncbi:lipopolysaccharide biosynthesis protein [Methylophilus sp. Leaf414]|uniref:lipopolysaccharide biosynthesis protein n=1 Tax=Methylophilus sp. Leaf414 TaxID=1736371 RepID=UPI000700968E|nr:lipopolysaccharide biosynthesis protein [Methylophilus sp. Leaf414]KQT34469.1 hypothetical protein ASG24_12215 [Methylophilus sp. Leaf414]
MSVMRNTKWVAVSQAAKVLSQLANIFVLARILPPSDYGLMAIAAVAINLALLIRDMGTASNIIQRPTLDHGIINAVFWLNIALGTVIFLIVLLLAPVIATSFNNDQLIGVLSLIALTFPMASSSAIHQALLERESKFKLLAKIEAFSALLAITVSLVAAWSGWGVYSLVIQVLVQAISVTVLLWINAPWKPSLDPQLYRLKELFHFSGNMAGYQLVSFAFRNADAVIIGKLLSSSALGVYSMAYKIMLFPIQNISWITTRAIFPLLSRCQHDLFEVRKLYLSALKGVSFFTAPLMTVLYVTRHDFILVSLGDKWGMITDLLIFMTPIGYLQAVSGTTGPVFMALGKTGFLFKFGIFGAVIHIILFIIGAQSGILEVTQCYLIASVVVTFLTFVFANKAMMLSTRDMLVTALPSVTLSLYAGSICLLFDQIFPIVNSVARFFTDCLVFSLSYLVLIYILSPEHLHFLRRHKVR